MPERKPPPVLVRFTDHDGAEWTVYDVTWSNKKHHRRPHGDATATERVFVNADGVRRAYKFKLSDTRVLEEQALERQLNAAAFLPTSKEDPSVYSLSEGERRTPTFRDDRPPNS
jgi:hypothetical protein